jgi:hypothetical protein
MSCLAVMTNEDPLVFGIPVTSVVLCLAEI